MLTTYELRKAIDHTVVIPSQHKVFQFPGGESHVQFGEMTSSTQIAFMQGGSGNDLMSLAMWADGVQRQGSKFTTWAVIPYLPGARMDRGAPLGAKVYADMINNMGIDRVICLDPHSDVAPALYDNLTVCPLNILPFWSTFEGSWNGVIAPDLGARKRAESVAKVLGVPVVQAQKHRDFATGQVSGFSCDPLDFNKRGRFLLVDDICDGGGTFIGLADHLNEAQGIVPDQLDLWVTHGIFSKDAMLKLTDHFSYVGSTDSHPGSDALNYSYSCTTKVVPILDRLVKVLTGGY